MNSKAGSLARRPAASPTGTRTATSAAGAPGYPLDTQRRHGRPQDTPTRPRQSAHLVCGWVGGWVWVSVSVSVSVSASGSVCLCLCLCLFLRLCLRLWLWLRLPVCLSLSFCRMYQRYLRQPLTTHSLYAKVRARAYYIPIYIYTQGRASARHVPCRSTFLWLLTY